MKIAGFLLSVIVMTVSGESSQFVAFSPFSKAKEPPKRVSLLSAMLLWLIKHFSYGHGGKRSLQKKSNF